jgi:hypothetical protein
MILFSWYFSNSENGDNAVNTNIGNTITGLRIRMH